MKKKPITYVFPIFLVILFVLAGIYFYHVFSPKHDTKQVQTINSLKGKKELYSNKVQAYEAYLRDSAIKVRKENVSIDLKSVFSNQPKPQAVIEPSGSRSAKEKVTPKKQRTEASLTGDHHKRNTLMLPSDLDH